MPMLNTNCRGDDKRWLDARKYRANLISMCNKTQEKRSYNMSQDSGNDIHAMSCQPSCKRQRVGLARESQKGPGCTRGVHDDISEHIQKVELTPKKRMLELKQKQQMEILEYFRTKHKRRESLDKLYRLEKDLICELCGQSFSKLDKLKKLDDEFKIKFEGLRHEMDKCWQNLRAAHLIARTDEEGTRLKRIELLKNSTALTLPADSGGAKIDVPSTSVGSENPKVSPVHSTLLESESVVSTLKDDKIYTSATLISSPVSPIQELSSREKFNLANVKDSSSDAEIFPDNLLMEGFMAISLDPDTMIHKSTVSVLSGEPVISSSSSVKELDAVDAAMAPENPKLFPFCSMLLHSKSGSCRDSPRLVHKDLPVSESQDDINAVEGANDGVVQSGIEISPNCWTIEEVTLKNGPNLASSVLVTDSQLLKESGQSISNGVVRHDDFDISHEYSPTEEKMLAISSDDEQMSMSSVPVPIDGFAFLVSSSIKQLDVPSAPVTSDNLNTSDCSPPLSESSFGATIMEKNHNHAPQNAISCSSPFMESECPKRGMRSSEKLAVTCDTVEIFSDSSCKEALVIYLDSDDEQKQISAAKPVDELEDANNLLEAFTHISSEQPNHFSVGCSRNEPAACLSSMGNQHKESQRMLGGISSGGSSFCVALSESGQGSMNQDSSVRELRQQTETRADICSFGLTEFASFSIPQQQCLDQGSELPLAQLPPSQLPCSEIRVTDASLPSPSCQYVCSFDAFLMQIGNHLRMHHMARGTEGNTQLHISDTSSNYYMNRSRNSHVRANDYHPARLDPLQVELEKFDKARDAAMKKHENMVVQLEVACDKEIAQIFHKYALLSQDAKNNFMQKKEELDVYYEKTKAHKLLAEAWALTNDENSPMFHPSSPVLPTGTQTNAYVLSPQLLNNLLVLGTSSADQIFQPYPSLCHESGQGCYFPNPNLRPLFPTPTIPLQRVHLSQSNQLPLNFCSSGSSAGSYSHLYSSYNIPI